MDMMRETHFPGPEGRRRPSTRAAHSQMRALQAKAMCGGQDEGERVTAALRRLRGSPAQLRQFLRDRDGVPTVDNVEALLVA